jgi:hypothetical protein
MNRLYRVGISLLFCCCLLFASPAHAAGFGSIGTATVDAAAGALHSILVRIADAVEALNFSPSHVAVAAVPSGHKELTAAVSNSVASDEPRTTTTASSTPRSAPYPATNAVRSSNPTPQPSLASVANNQANFVTQNSLGSQLNELANSLRSLIYSQESAPGSLPASGGNFNNVALSQIVDNLSNVTLSNATVDGISGLTAADIPVLNYFPATSTISIFYGGTGTSTVPTANKLLFSDANGNWEYVATSSLGITAGSNYSFSYPLLDSSNTVSLAFGTTTPNVWSSLQTFANASTSQLSVLGPAYFGTTDTSTFGADGSLTLAGALTYGGVTLNNFVSGTGNLVLSSSPTLVSPTLGTPSSVTLTNATGLPINTGVSGLGTGVATALETNNVILAQPTLNNYFLGASGNTAGTGTDNTASGYTALSSVTTGAQNFAAGFSAANALKTGTNDIAIGPHALDFATNGGTYNTAIGTYAMIGGVTGNYNIGIGDEPMAALTSGSDNIAIGRDALDTATTTGGQVAIGALALNAVTSGSNNTAVGNLAARALVTGAQNVALGYQALTAATDSTYSIAIGSNALASYVRGASYNLNSIAIGANALEDDTSGYENVAIGTSVLGVATSSYWNVAVGIQAMQSATSANQNVAIGLSAADYLTSGTFNTCIGDQACGGTSGSVLTTGSYNTIIGAGANLMGLVSGSYNTILGAQVTGLSATLSNAIVLSDGQGNIRANYGYTNAGEWTFPSITTFSNSTYSALFTGGNVGIGTTTPYAPLEVWGPDSAATTTAFLVANNASSTDFAVYDNGNATYSGSIFQSSDQRLKTDITTLDASSSLSAIESLNPVSYLRLDQPGTGENLGFIAQAVQKIYPELVSTTSATALTPDGTLTLNYEGLISPIVSAIQDIAAISGNFETDLIAWLGNASNGIGDLFAENIHAQNELCIGTTCIDQAQLQSLLAESGQSGEADVSSPAASPSTTTPPSLRINGDNPAVLEVGDWYADLGAIATDSQGHTLGIQTYVEGTLESPIVIDTSAPATDTIDYVATDSYGNTATSTRTVIVEAASSTVSVVGAEATSSAGGD